MTNDLCTGFGKGEQRSMFYDRAYRLFAVYVIHVIILLSGLSRIAGVVCRVVMGYIRVGSCLQDMSHLPGYTKLAYSHNAGLCFGWLISHEHLIPVAYKLEYRRLANISVTYEVRITGYPCALNM